jgi:hypothetical protein
VNLTQVATGASHESRWLASARFDLAFLILPGLYCLCLLVPYQWIGSAAVMPIYALYLVLFGLPHNYLTWATILPSASRKALPWKNILALIATSGIICVALFLSTRGRLGEQLLSAIAVLSIWHVYRQHHGIAKIYDAVQAKRERDPSIFADRELLSDFFGLASLGVVVWVFTHPNVHFLMSTDENYEFVHPLVSPGVFRFYLALTATTGVLGLKRAIYDRARKGLPLPWPQLALMMSALASFWGPYAFLPLDAMPLAMAIATIFHNLQYFAFVWLYERARSPDLAREDGLALPQRLVSEGRWKAYFALALVFSAVVITAYGIIPRRFGTFVIYFIGVSHYLVDGAIWRARSNRHLGPALARISRNVTHLL